MPSKKPKYDLSQVKQIVEKFLAGDLTKLWFSARSRSVAQVMTILRCSEKEAEEKIAHAILRLEPADFSDNNFQWGITNDIYGLENYEDHNWYLKFNILNEDGLESVNQISFHPVEDFLLVANGRVLKVTYKPENLSDD